MPIRVQNDLPVKEILEKENIFVMDEFRATHQDIRPIRIGLLNLMPLKEDTELQLLRSLSNTPLQVDIVFVTVKSHESKNTSANHLNRFYETFDKVKNQKFDGFIITGAPVEQMPFEEVDYWDELCELFDFSLHHVYSTMHICWGAQAALYYHYGIPKHDLKEKLFGVFEQRVVRKHSPLVRGFDEIFFAPHSRHTEVRKEDILKHPELRIIVESHKAGPHIISTDNGRQIFVTGHQEYDKETLALEYFRDVRQGLRIKVPENYFRDDDPKKEILSRWRGHTSLLFSNWLNYYVYQETPFDLEQLKEKVEKVRL